LPEFQPVEAGQLVATVKIIPFAVSVDSLAAAERAVDGGPLLSLAPFRPRRIGLVATTLPSLKPSVLEKTRLRLEARLAAAGSVLIGERRVPHEAAAVGEALLGLAGEGADLLVVFGASAMVDAGDVVPAGIEAAGGRIVRLGMPVDPGNLLVLADLGGVPVIGAPGCARSPKENGFDWVLRRLLAGLDVTADDIAGLGVGGLLSEIGTRPQPRERHAEAGGVAALILAAGEGRRMGGPTKQLAELGGQSLVRRVAEAALASRAAPVVVVTGHERDAVEAELAGLDVVLTFNGNYRGGLSTSLRRGVEALPSGASGVLVLLADMPFVTPSMLNRLIDTFEAVHPHPIVAPTHSGKRGNPVLWPHRHFAALQAIEGDTGARHLIASHADEVVEVAIGEAAALDLDTPEALAKAGGRIVR
jgi:molybdenum cofactor cytidylyltransferase